jgi:hypothetical protein
MDPLEKGFGFWLIAMLVCAATPLWLWKARNWHQRQFDGLSDVSGVTAWQYLGSRVKAQVNGQDRFMVLRASDLEESSWGLSIQEADDERWRRARAIFREHPILTVYCFIRSAGEHAVHPSPDVLTPARLNFYGDFWVLGLLWGGLLILAYLGWRCTSDPVRDDGEIDRGWLLTILVICFLLTLSSGISFGQGSRMRAPLELIVPLLAGVGILRLVRAF